MPMIIDVYLDRTIKNKSVFEAYKNECDVSIIHTIRAGYFVVSYEVLKPKRTSNHEGTNKSI